ncbi:MAG TPA: diguanylate cyclase, partial [Thermoanaerobaculaceae bacterium]|nr:diguanylate cyclase [Thermoanaerobaculaceae bacterium]
ALWVGTVAGLARVDSVEPRRMQRVPGLPAGEVAAIQVAPDGSLLVGVTGAGLFAGAPGEFHRVGDGSTPLLRVRALLREAADPDALWIGTEDAGALRLKGGAWQPFGPAEGFPRAAVYTIFEDREGILWFGTSDGLVKRGPSAFATFTVAEGFPDHTIAYGMAEAPGGVLYFALSDDGVVRMRPDGSVRRFTSRDGLPPAGATDVEVDPRGGVWVATRGGLGRIDGDRASTYRLPAGSPTALRSMLALPDGTLYLGSYREGLAVLKDGTLTRIGPPVGSTVAALTLGRDGTIWCGGEGWGVVGLRSGRPPVTIGPAEQLPAGHISQIFEDSSGNLWIGSEQGAWRRDPRGHISIVNRASGLPDSYVYWIREAADGAMWFGTNHGAVRKPPGGEYQLFTSRDGLAADECNEDSVMIDSRGRLFVGSEGVSVFLGTPVPSPRVPCPVVVEEVRVGAASFPNPASLRVQATAGPVTFHLAAPTFAAEEGTRFRYRLVGASDEWRTTEPSEVETTYAGLAPGRYRFEALGIAADGRVSPRPAIVSLVVLPRWWQSPLAIGAVALLLAFGLIATIRLRERRLEAAKARLERQVLARTDELRQANERLAVLAVNDDLTGLANRRAALERLRDAMAESRRHRRPLAIALVDLDRFKEVNDALGHEMGDTVLRQVAAAMRQSLRQEDLLGRHGGDEFLAVMPGCGEEGARQAGLRMQQAIAKVPLPLDQLAWAAEGLTASIGVATYDGADEDIRQLVRWADAELYRAKAAGRNRVSVHVSR